MKKLFALVDWKKEAKSILFVVTGTVIAGLGILFFIDPSNLYTGGITGLAQLIINVVEDKRAITDSSSIRTAALAQNVPYYTTLAGAEAACLGMKDRGEITVYDLQSLHQRLG